MFRNITFAVVSFSLLAPPLGCAVNDSREQLPALLDTLPESETSAIDATSDTEHSVADVGRPPVRSNAVRPVTFLQTEGEGETGITFAVDAEFEGEVLEVVMISILFDPGKFKIIGSPDLVVTATIRALSIDDAMQQLQDQSDVLIVKLGERYIVYSEGAEDQVAGETINYIYKCRRAKATDIVGIIDGVPPEGFPSAGELSTGEPIAPLQEVALGSEIMASAGLTNPLGTVEFQVVHHMNGIILRGTLSEVRNAVNFLKTVDRPIPIVLIELLVVQYFHEDGFTWRYDLFDGQIARADAPVSNGPPPLPGTGISLDNNQNNTFGPTRFDPATGAMEGPGYGWNFERIAMNAATGAFPLHFSAIGSLTSAFKHNVTFLCREELARIVTNPHVGVINGHQGTIMLNEKFNFFTNIVQPITGAIEEQQQEINNITGLTVTPTIVGPDRIHMAINATVSAFTDILTTSELPNQRINEIATSVVLGDNETLIIGGLVKEEIIEDRSKTPGFANIPLAGYLFRSKQTTRRFTETVIYVTPHLAQPQGYEDAYLKQIFRQVDRLGQRVETIRDKHRHDKRTSHQMYRWNERLDHQQCKETCREEVDHHRQMWRHGHGHHAGHPCYPAYEVIESGEAQPTPGGQMPPDVPPEDDGGVPGFGVAPGEDVPSEDEGGFPGFEATRNEPPRAVPAPVVSVDDLQLVNPFRNDPAPPAPPPVP